MDFHVSLGFLGLPHNWLELDQKFGLTRVLEFDKNHCKVRLWPEVTHFPPTIAGKKKKIKILFDDDGGSDGDLYDGSEGVIGEPLALAEAYYEEDGGGDMLSPHPEGQEAAAYFDNSFDDYNQMDFKEADFPEDPSALGITVKVIKSWSNRASSIMFHTLATGFFFSTAPKNSWTKKPSKLKQKNSRIRQILV